MISLVLRRIAVLAAVLFITAGARAQTPLISAFAGTGSNTFFFALDFRDFPAPQSYAFGYRSNATTVTFLEILNGLSGNVSGVTGVPTFTSLISNSVFGASLDGLGYAGKTKFNNFAGNNSGEPNGYWSQWNSPNGFTNWAFNNSGISGQNVAAGQWVGASWTADFNTVADVAPRTPIISAAAPEPGAFALLSLGGFVGIAARRRRLFIAR